jgi:hypothetical protein
LSSRSQESTASRDKTLNHISAILLALLPAASFLAQLVLSYRAGTQGVLFHHLTVMVADWVFVPFNFLVVSTIEWRRGGRLYVIACASIVLNVFTHAFWQYNGLDPGHMITQTGVVLPAGWVHLTFSTLEMILLVAFVFCRKSNASRVGVTTAIAVTYFSAMCACGYIIHHGFIVSDVSVFLSGLFFTLIYPRIAYRNQAYQLTKANWL